MSELAPTRPRARTAECRTATRTYPRAAAVAIAALVTALALTLVVRATAQQPKPPIAFADTATITLVCPSKGRVKQQIEIQNDTAQAQTVKLRVSQLRDEGGIVHDASEACGGVRITASLKIDGGGLTNDATISAGKTSGGSAAYSGTVAAFTAGGPVIRRPLEVREAAASAPAKPLVSSVEATVYRGRPWGDQHIDVPVAVAPDKTLALGEGDVVGALAGGGDSGAVTYAGKHKLNDKTTNVELAVAGLGPDEYEGDVDLVPGADEGKVTLKLTEKDWWLYPAFFIFLGILAGLPFQHWLNVSLPQGRLLGRVDETATRHEEAKARLAEAARAAGGKTWGSYALSDLAAQQEELRRVIRQETKTRFLALDSKVVEGLEAKIKALEDEIDRLNTVHEKMSGLELAIGLAKGYPLADLPPPGGVDPARREPLLTKNASPYLTGAALSAAELKKRLADADEAALGALDIYAHEQDIAHHYKELQALEPLADDATKKEKLATIFDDLEATWHKIWNAPDAKHLSELKVSEELDKINDAIALLWAQWKVPSLREQLVLGGGEGAAITLPLTPGEEDGGASPPDGPSRAPEAAGLLMRGYAVAVTAFIIALVTALTALYIGKPFGTFWDYVGALTWGLATQAVLTTLATAVGGVAGLRAIGQRLRGA